MLAAAREERRNSSALLKDDLQKVEHSKVQNTGKNESDTDSDDEFDYLLDEEIETTSAEHYYEAQRRAELESMARNHEVLRYHGYGVHRQMHPQRIFPSVGYRNADKDRYIPPGAVVHLYDAHSPLSVSLDLCLESIASKYPGTKFVRGLGITSILYAEECEDGRWKNGDLPMLLALRDGKVAAFSSGLRDFTTGQDAVEPRAVEQWLDHANVLIDALPPVDAVCRIRPEEDMLMENMRQLRGLGRQAEEIDNADAQNRYDCGVDGCNKSFFHEHVGVKNDAQDGMLVSESQVLASAEPSSN